uniref:DPNP n=1 Tax=Arundo donax TaxID=35708 RepID=A0A0A9G7P9_ARUDO
MVQHEIAMPQPKAGQHDTVRTRNSIAPNVFSLIIITSTGGRLPVFFSLMDCWTACRSDGINCLFVAMMPVSRSRNLPLEKSKSFPAASVTIPPASVTTIEPAAWSHIFSL